jgi:hypothetical protein
VVGGRADRQRGCAALPGVIVDILPIEEHIETRPRRRLCDSRLLLILCLLVLLLGYSVGLERDGGGLHGGEVLRLFGVPS